MQRSTFSSPPFPSALPPFFPPSPLPFPPPHLRLLRSRPLQSSQGVWGSAVSSPSGVWGGASAEIEFGAFEPYNLTSGGNNCNDFPENQLTKIQCGPPRRSHFAISCNISHGIVQNSAANLRHYNMYNSLLLLFLLLSVDLSSGISAKFSKKWMLDTFICQTIELCSFLAVKAHILRCRSEMAIQ